MIVDLDECMPLLRCPRTQAQLRRLDADTLVADGASPTDRNRYPIVGGKPVLIDYSDSAFSDTLIVETSAQSAIERKQYKGIQKLIKKLLSPRQMSTRNNVNRLIAELDRKETPPLLLMVGGGSIGKEMEPLYEHPRIRIYGFDVYASPHVQFVADAHHIPLPDNQFDAVVVQAVLEHVVQPSQVVAEIWRVLRPDGLVYAETPFMQQVHEGAFDFTRFSESGHRYLFRRFARIASGASAGPGTQFMWSVDYLARGVFRSVTAGKLAKLAFFWTQYLDRWIPPAYAEDGASGVFFYGRKSCETITPRDIVEHYRGAQQ